MKKETAVKNQELIGSNPVRHRVIGGNSTQTTDNRAFALSKVHGSRGMQDTLFSGHDNSELKRGNERNKKTEFHISQAKVNGPNQVRKATAGVQWVYGQGTKLTLQ